MRNGNKIRYFDFGPFRVDTREKLLLRDGDQVRLTPKAFEILLVLVEGHGRTLGKDELIDHVWADTFVDVGNLNRNISTLRSVLGDDSHKPRYIKTFPKRGYRFECEVTEIPDDDEALITSDGPSLESSSNKESRLTGRGGVDRRIAYVSATAGAFIVAVLLFAYFVLPGETEAGGNAQTGHGHAEAREMYERGRSLWRTRSGESLYKATVILEEAVAVDPDFALAYSALADAYAFDTKNRTRAAETARKAIELDPTIGEPHATLGFLKMFWEWTLDEAGSHFREAISLSPDYATGHQWYAINLMASGQGHAALVEMQKAAQLEPDSLAINADLCQMLYFIPRLDEAERQCRKTIDMDPAFTNASLVLYEVLMARGSYDEAVAQFFKNEEMLKHYSTRPDELIALKKSYETGDIRAFWKKRVAMLEKRADAEYDLALHHARLGNVDKVFTELNKAVEKHDLNFLLFSAEPVFIDCCYSDPRYAKLRADAFSATPDQTISATEAR